MAIEHYSLCPCGSGKKIKFCKCVDSIGELDRIMKMINGNQVVAALDRLNQVLKSHPDAAWALAVKGRLLISLGETKTLAENAERFIRLQPSNPLALAQQGVGRIFENNNQGAAESLLLAFAESGAGVDSFLLETASLLAFGLARAGSVLSARLYATLPLGAADFEEAQMAANVLNELNRSQEINLLLKSLPINQQRPEDVAWAERFDEAMALLYSQQIPAAESKLEGLDRQYPGQPAILSGLVACALWKADESAQSRLLAKFASALKDDPEAAARMKALSLLVDPEASESSVAVSSLSAELSDVDEAIAALTASDRFEHIGGRGANQFDGLFEVPPKMVFSIRDLPENFGAPADAPFTRSLGMVFVFGRQTDRAPEVKALDIRENNRVEVEALLRDVLQLKGEFQRDANNVPLHLLLQPRLSPSRAGVDFTAAFEEIQKIAPKLILQTIVDSPLVKFQGKSLRELADAPETQTLRTAMFRIIEGIDAIRPDLASVLPELASILRVPMRETIEITSEEQLEELTPLDLTVVNVATLDPESLMYFFQRTQQVNCQTVARAAAERLVNMSPEELAVEEDEQESVKATVMRAHVELIHAADNEAELEKFASQAHQWCTSLGLDGGFVLFQELQACVSLNLPERMRNVLTLLTTRHGDNAEIMALVQRFLMQIGVLNPDGSPRGGGRPAPSGSAAGPMLGGGGQAEAGPEIITSPNAPAANSGKLWLPGMD